jgi:acyl-CoA reductase-like NAD-dependent aldehyde dehydrogenase
MSQIQKTEKTGFTRFIRREPLGVVLTVAASARFVGTGLELGGKDPAYVRADEPGTPYMASQVLVDVDQRMRVMSEESFGPVVGIVKVASDEQAIALMNDSAYGLTASIWTRDTDAAISVGDRVYTGESSLTLILRKPRTHGT